MKPTVTRITPNMLRDRAWTASLPPARASRWLRTALTALAILALGAALGAVAVYTAADPAAQRARAERSAAGSWM